MRAFTGILVSAALLASATAATPAADAAEAIGSVELQFRSAGSGGVFGQPVINNNKRQVSAESVSERFQPTCAIVLFTSEFSENR